MKKQYQIGDKQFFTAELTLAQDEKAFELLQEIGITDFFSLGLFDAVKLIEALGKKKKLRQFLAVILIPVNGEFDENNLEQIQIQVGKLTNSQIIEVCEDFFGFNRPSLQKLGNYFQKLWKQVENKIEILSEMAKKAEPLRPATPAAQIASPKSDN